MGTNGHVAALETKPVDGMREFVTQFETHKLANDAWYDAKPKGHEVPSLFSLCWSVIEKETKKAVPNILNEADSQYEQIIHSCNAKATAICLEGEVQLKQSIEMAELQRAKVL